MIDTTSGRAGLLHGHPVGAGPLPAGAAVVTGVFDLLHVGHIRFLEAVRARAQALVVGVEDDARTRAWKGTDRPMQPEAERAEILRALRAVDGVFVIHGDPVVTDWASYTHLLSPLAPGALAFTSGDPHAESKRQSARALGVPAWEVPFVPGHSTTVLVHRAGAGEG